MKKNKIEADKITFGTYYQAFQVAKKGAQPSPSLGGTQNPFGALSQASKDEL